MKAIAQTSGAKFGPPKLHNQGNDLPVRMKSQTQFAEPEEFVALETTEVVINSVKKATVSLQNRRPEVKDWQSTVETSLNCSKDEY